jgi:hypothetical protein
MELPYKKLLLDIKIRWNSLYLMICRILYMWEPVNELLKLYRPDLKLTEKDYEVLL